MIMEMNNIIMGRNIGSKNFTKEDDCFIEKYYPIGDWNMLMKLLDNHMLERKWNKLYV